MQLSSHDATDIPEQYLPYVLHYLYGFRNDTVDFSKPYLKPYFANIYPLIVGVYIFLIIPSTLSNCWMILHIIKYNMQEPSCVFLLNIAVASLFHVVFVLPITLAVILMHNWIFGYTLCYLIPIFQYQSMTDVCDMFANIGLVINLFPIVYYCISKLYGWVGSEIEPETINYEAEALSNDPLQALLLSIYYE